MTAEREKELSKKTKKELIEIIRGYETKKEGTNIPLNLTSEIKDSSEVYSFKKVVNKGSRDLPLTSTKEGSFNTADNNNPIREKANKWA